MSAPDNAPAPLGFGGRLAFAWLAFFRILFDGAFAARLFAARDALPGAAVKEPKDAAKTQARAPEAPVAPGDTDNARERSSAALQLLTLLQREGRLVDFLEQDIAAFADADVGAAARVVHEGARKALRAHVTLEPVRQEEEGTQVVVEQGSPAVKLTGNVAGSAPYRGLLRHKGWRATEIKLPTLLAGHDARIVAPAEVEL